MKAIFKTSIIAAIIAAIIALSAAPAMGERQFTGILTVISDQNATLIDYSKSVGIKSNNYETTTTLDIGLYTFAIESDPIAVWSVECDGVKLGNGSSFSIAIHSNSDIYCKLNALSRSASVHTVYMPIISK